MKPADDLCSKCRSLSQATLSVANENDDAKLKVANETLHHINSAARQLKYYNSYRTKAAEMTPDEFLVISIDYAQNVSYPSGPLQLGIAYFTSLRKCGVFGIVNEGTKVRSNYPIDEEFSIGKGPSLKRADTKRLEIFE